MNVGNNIRPVTLIIFATLTLLTGCFYDDEATLYPESANCDPTAVATFNAEVMPLLNSRCNGCHAGTSPSGGIKLNSYNEVIKYVDNGSLMGSVNHASGFSPMPKNSGKMTPCQIQKIQSWIESGAANN